MPHVVSDAELRVAWEALRTHDSREAAARALDIPSTTLQYRVQVAMQRLGLPNPKTPLGRRSFTADPPPDRARSIEELRAHRRAESDRARAYEEFIELIEIKIETPGPVGIMIFGDPHIDNPGCYFSLLESHLKIAADRPDSIFAGNIGDLRDNWVGRLERLYAETTVSAKETWRLVEWMMRDAGVNWTWLIRGNHDAWAGINDPLDWIARSAGVGVDQNAGARIAFRHPNGRETRLHARHDFQGRSIYNPLHGLKREILNGHRDHILAAGHQHIGCDAGDFIADLSFQMIRVSGYKVSDAYRVTIGAKAKPLHPAALVIVDPDEPDDSRARAWCAPTVEEGAAYLDWKRARFTKRKRKG